MSTQTNLTNYDLFMLKKRDAKDKLFGGSQAERSYWKNETASPVAERASGNILFPQKTAGSKAATKVNFAEKSKAKEYLAPKVEKELTYKEYLLGQLSRIEPEKMLTEDEFYGKEKTPVNQIAYMETASTSVNRKNTSEKSNTLIDKIIKKVYGNGELKKSGKVFLALYVIIVIAVALTLIVTTAAFPGDSDMDLKVSANTTSYTEEVQPMTIEGEETESNWFDRLCDSLNK